MLWSSVLRRHLPFSRASRVRAQRLRQGFSWGSKRDDAARFSFLLGAPIIAGAGLKSLYDVFKESQSGALGSGDLFLYLVGFVASAITGFFTIKFLLQYLRTHTTDIFVYYRWALAVFLIIVALVRG